MVNIYCITDCNGLNYVGSTKYSLKRRLDTHKSEKKANRYNVTSHLLDLENCEIKLIEECDEINRIEREMYWINKIDCVNHVTMKLSYKEYQKQYQANHKELNKEYKRNLHIYKTSWGGSIDSYECNLLRINTDLFL